MRKTLSVVLALVLLLGAVCIIPTTVLAEGEATAEYYSKVDFTEEFYSENLYSHAYKGGELTDDPVEGGTRGKVIKNTSISCRTSSNPGRWGQYTVVADAAGVSYFAVEKGKKYFISFDILRVSNTEAFYVYLAFTNGGASLNDIPYNAENHVGTYYTASTTPSTDWEHYSGTEFTAMATGQIVLVLRNTKGSSGSKTDCEVYIDNIVISEAATLTCVGTDGDQTTIDTYADKTYEEALPKTDSVRWYLDEACTTPATGVINAVAATVYAKEDFYTTVTFDEAVYTSDSANSLKTATIADDATTGKAVKFTEVTKTAAENAYQAFKIADEAGTGYFKVKADTTYNISFDLKRVTVPGAFNISLRVVSDLSSFSMANDNYLGVTSTSQPGYWEDWWDNYSFTPTTGGYLVLVIHRGAGGACEVYFDNIVVATGTAITYSGADATELPTTAWANQTYEELLGDAAADWYLNDAGTKAATGVINSNAVTLYAKASVVEPSFGVDTPSAGLFVDGDSSANEAAGIVGTAGSAVYEVGGTKYTAFRVFGTYVAPAKTDGEGADYGKVVVDANGTTKNIVSRHVMLGYKAEPTLDNNYAMSTVSANFENCWSTEINDDGTYTVTYSLLLKNIPEQYANTAFYANSALVVEGEAEPICGEAKSGVSAYSIYQSALEQGYTVGWFDAAE